MASDHFDSALCCLEEEGQTMAARGHVKSNSPRGLAEDTAVTALQGRLSPEGLSCFRPSYAMPVFAGNDDIRRVQELLGYKDVNTTMIYPHVLNRGGRGVRSSMNSLSLGARSGVSDETIYETSPIRSNGAATLLMTSYEPSLPNRLRVFYRTGPHCGSLTEQGNPWLDVR